MTQNAIQIRYLSRADIERLAIPGGELADRIEATIRACAAGQARNFPKTSMACPDGRLFQSTMAVGVGPPAPAFAATKIVGLSPANTDRGLPHIGGVIVLNDGSTGMPAAIMDATWVTEMRTAALSLVAARRYARRDADSIGFIGCGAQAKSHLAVFVEAFPLTRVTAYSRRRSSAEALAARARAMGLEAIVAEDPRQVVSGQAIVISTVPGHPNLVPFLRADWLSRGSFGSLVDLGRSWSTEGFERIDYRLVDDKAQAEASKSYRKLTPEGPYSADLLDMVTVPTLGRKNDEERAVFTFQGVALADLAAAALVMETAARADIGQLLPM